MALGAPCAAMLPITGRVILRPGQFLDLGRHHVNEHPANRPAQVVAKNFSRLRSRHLPELFKQTRLIHDDGLLTVGSYGRPFGFSVYPRHFRRGGDHRQLLTISGTLPTNLG